MIDQSIAILIPAYNAGSSIPRLLERLELEVSRGQVLVVDDGSQDHTSKVASERGVSVLRHDRNMGKGAALRTGFAWLGRRQDWEAVVTMDADLQHGPDDLPKFAECYRDLKPGLVLGTRERFGTGMPLSRILSNTITSALISARCATPIIDSQCGYRLLSRDLVQRVRFDSDGYEAETELLVRSLLMGFSVATVPIQTVYGDETSHMRPWQTTKNFISVLFRDY